MATTFRAVEAGAVAVLEKPRGIGHPDYENTVRNLIQTVKLMSEVKVVKRWARCRQTGSGYATPLPLVQEDFKEIAAGVKVVAVGASTGGPLVLQTILSRLPGNFPLRFWLSNTWRWFYSWVCRVAGSIVQFVNSGCRAG
ncbi:MAG: hypothetical protein U0586_03730 [Candidatus Brocadiaceae bacterium]